MTKLTWLSHGSWLIESDAYRILLDPFLNENPAATIKSGDLNDINYILISHGHQDHMEDAAAIANANHATIVAIFEMAQWFADKHSVASTIGMNLGGSLDLPFGGVKMVPALHSSSLPDGTYAGHPAGFVLTIRGKHIYFACDTGLFSDMRLHAHSVDLAVLPIGDLYTMGVDDSIRAIKMIEPKCVLPAHYNTFPEIEQDAARWASRVTQETYAVPVVLEVGEEFEL